MTSANQYIGSALLIYELGGTLKLRRFLRWLSYSENLMQSYVILKLFPANKHNGEFFSTFSIFKTQTLLKMSYEYRDLCTNEM